MSCLLSRIPRVQSRPCRRLLTLSAVQGPTKPPLDLRTLPEYFYSEILEHNSERPALICRAEKPLGHGGPPSRNMGIRRHLAWDFDNFERHVISLARGLVAMGVKKGDRVGVIMGNNRYDNTMLVLKPLWLTAKPWFFCTVPMRCCSGLAQVWVLCWLRLTQRIGFKSW